MTDNLLRGVFMEILFCWNCLTFGVYAKVIKKYMCNGFAEREDDGEEEKSTLEIECYECGSLNLAQTNIEEWDEELKEEVEDFLVSLYRGEYSAEIPTIILLLAAAGKIKLFHYSRRNYKDFFKPVDRKEALERLRREIISSREDVIDGIRCALEHEKIAKLVKPAVEDLGIDILAGIP